MASAGHVPPKSAGEAFAASQLLAIFLIRWLSVAFDVPWYFLSVSVLTWPSCYEDKSHTGLVAHPTPV